MQNILLKGGYLIDGTGAAIKRKDLLIKNGYINEIAENIPFQGDVTCLDVRGMHITPGFIDIHSHADWDIFALPGCTNKLMQGVTTEVINNCGLSSFPISETYREDLLDYLHTQSVALPEKITWNSLDGYREVITKKGHGSNLLALVGHGSLRIAIVGLNDKKLNNKELQAMQTLLEKLLQEGAAGLSMGLVYPPSAYADQEEMLVLAKVLKKYNAV